MNSRVFARVWMFCLLACALPVTVHAAQSARQQLQGFIDQVHAASGSFQQSQIGAQGASRQVQQGLFSFQRPGKFRWEVLQPYEQLIVSDGQRVYQYDPDLDQVTERSAGQAIGTSPAALLFGSGSLDQSFDLQQQPDSDGLQWLRAIPKAADAGFVHADIGFSQGMPQRLDLLDAFGQVSRIRFTDLQANPDLPAETFSFTVPDGADLVKMD